MVVSGTGEFLSWQQLVLLLVQILTVFISPHFSHKEKLSFPDMSNWPDFYLILQEPPQGTTNARKALKHIKMVHLLSKLHSCFSESLHG